MGEKINALRFLSKHTEFLYLEIESLEDQYDTNALEIR